MNRKRIRTVSILLILSAGIILPSIYSSIIKAEQYKTIHVIWKSLTITDSYDAGNNKGEFILQVKYCNSGNWRKDGSGIFQTVEGTNLKPGKTFTLSKKVDVNSYIYIRLVEYDGLFQKSDQIIEPFQDNSGKGLDDGTWSSENRFYMGSSFSSITIIASNSAGDIIEVKFESLD
ncbi:MAG: hypothetical protein ACTSQE_10935 [Candidatus Heimdallarchaeaceae archaeon]